MKQIDQGSYGGSGGTESELISEEVFEICNFYFKFLAPGSEDICKINEGV